MTYFRKRKAVIFLSSWRFWEKHAFVQQSLAKALTDLGVNVVWLDGAGWRAHKPTLYWNSPRLKVTQLSVLPLRKASISDYLSVHWQCRQINSYIKKLGGDPVIWVQAGFDERVIEKLPYVDIFSTFDDPYNHEPMGPLCRKAKLIIAQNEFSFSRFVACHRGKVIKLLPPMDIGPDVFGEPSGVLPETKRLSKQCMGYIGTFFANGFDMGLFECFVKNLPEFDFLLAGRTCKHGLSYMNRFKHRYKNFTYIPWVPRAELANIWRKLDVTLLLYSSAPQTHGAFPVKILESLYFGVSAVATNVPKTQDLEGVFPRHTDPHRLMQAAMAETKRDKGKLLRLFRHFKTVMDPRLHLAKVAEFLSTETLEELAPARPYTRRNAP